MNLNSSGFCCHSSCLDHFHLDYTALMHQSPAQTNHYKLNLGGTSVSQVHTRPAFDVRGPQCCSDIMSSAFYSEYHSFGTTMSPYQHQDCASLPCSPQLPTAPSMHSIEVPSQGYSLDLRAQTRERYTGKGQRKIKARDQGSAHCKAKHTRPTFSGYQIFILEKTFEQNKYLSSVERDKMAYTLGMSQDQVKVWFQNRRTKWKKRNGVSKSVSTKGGRWEQSGAACSNLAEIRDYDRPLDPNSDDERIHLLLQKHSNDCLHYGHQPY